MRTGIYGGTFNPIHLAHVHLVRAFIEQLSLNRVLLIPTGQPQHKAAAALACNADRLAMCRLAAAEISECPVEVSDIEMRRAGKSYTADTLTALRGQYPQDDFYLLMGEDMFLTVERWYEPEKIFREATVCAAPRDYGSFRRLIRHGEAVRKTHPAFGFILQNIPFLPVSSTEIRGRIQSGGPLDDLLPRGVIDYIEERGLYKA